MSWDCLSAEIGAMFEDYTTREVDRQLSLEWWVAERLLVRQQNNKTWRAMNRQRVRELKRKWQQSDIGRAYRREWMRQWRAENQETARTQALEQQRKRRQQNPEAHREYMRQWRAKNAERERERLRRWRLANPERVREIQREKYQRDKARRAA